MGREKAGSRNRSERAASDALQAQRADPVRFLRERAKHYEAMLRLPKRVADEGVDLVAGLVGPDWIARELSRKVPSFDRPTKISGLAHAFGVGSETSVVEVLEVGLYLKHLMTSPGFDEVVGNLRNDFESTLLQLAVAYRIKLHGPQIELEPATRGGRRGDIAFRWMGRDYLVECYVRQTPPDNLSGFFSHSIGRILDTPACNSRRLRIGLRFRHAPTDVERKTLERELIDACASLAARQRADCSTGVADFWVEDLGSSEEVDVEPDGRPSSRGPYSDCHAIIGGFRVPVSEVLQPIDPRRLRVPGTRMLVWRPAEHVPSGRERASKFASRIEKKLEQTRALSGNARRVVVAQLETGRPMDVRNRKIGRAIQGRIVRNHRLVAMTMLCTRVWTQRQRYAYVGMIAEGNEPDDFPAAMMRWAGDTDYTRDLLVDWNRRL